MLSFLCAAHARVNVQWLNYKENGNMCVSRKGLIQKTGITKLTRTLINKNFTNNTSILTRSKMYKSWHQRLIK